MRENKKNRTFIYRILLVIFTIGLIACVSILIWNCISRHNADKLYEELSSNTTEQGSEALTEAATEEPDQLTLLGITVPDKKIDWAALETENSDIYAWIYIPNTNIDYPILQHPTDDNYYLQHNLDGSYGYPGCIYSQSMNRTDFTDPNTVLYGHNMGDGSMFHTLHDFEDNVFFTENPYVYIYTPDGVLVYEIYAACEFGDEHLFHRYDFTATTDYQSFLDDMKGSRGMKDHIRENTSVGTDNHVLTLSTCVKDVPDKRYLVGAVLVNEEGVE